LVSIPDAMARPAKSDLSGSMAILGLLIQRPDTASGVALRLTEEFPRTQWAKSLAYNTLPSLAKQGFARLIEKGPKDSKDRYEATKEGIDEFRGWLRESVAVAPALRDVLHATLALVGDEDLPWLVDAIKDQEESCRQQAEQAQRRRNEAKRKGLLGKSRPRDAMMTYEVVLWSQTAGRLKRLRKDLEDGDDEEIGESVEHWGAGGSDG
jgi:DNA-binding PadR family transcriptional regulator